MIAHLPGNESARLEWLRQANILDTPPEVVFDDITSLAARICGAPIVAISLIDQDRQWFKSICGLDAKETSRDVAFCAHAILQTGIMVVPDALEDPRFADNPLVTGEPKIRFYAGAPMITSDNYAIGTLCVIDRQPRRLSTDQIAVLEMLARHAVSRIEIQRQIAIQQHMTMVAIKAEDNYRALFENAIEGMFQSTPEGRFIQANRALARLLGYASPEELMTSITNIAEQVYVDPDQRVEFQRLMHSNGRVVGFEMQAQLPHGVKWISMSAKAVYDGAGEIKCYQGYWIDISDRKALEESHERELLEAVERAKHDPLTGLWNHRSVYWLLDEALDTAEREGTSIAVVKLDIDNFKFFNSVYGHLEGDDVLIRVAQRLQASSGPNDILGRFGSDEFVIIMPDVGDRAGCEIEARLRGELSGLVYHSVFQQSAIPISISSGLAIYPNDCEQRRELVRRADERLLRHKTGGEAAAEAGEVTSYALTHVAGFSMLDALVTAVDNKDRYTRRHSEDVLKYALMIARELGMDDDAQRAVGISALIHDVGKIGVPDAILRKPGRLTAQEFEAIKQHPQMGWIMVSAIPGLECTLDAVRLHHERWDGAGYPLGLQGENIPLVARLTAVADAYSAMTTDRPYRQGMGYAKAMSILEAGAGTQWDAKCVRALQNAFQNAFQRSLPLEQAA